MNSSARAEWLVPAALIALSALPVGAGAVRLAELSGGAEITPANARFFAAPLPAVLHILSVSVYCVLGAFQFPPAYAAGDPTGIAVLDGCWFPSDLSPHFRDCG